MCRFCTEKENIYSSTNVPFDVPQNRLQLRMLRMLRMLRNLQKMRRNEIRRRRGAQTSNRPVPKSLRRHQNCQSFRTKQKVNLKLQNQKEN